MVSPNVIIKAENISKVFSLRTPATDANGNSTNQLYALKDLNFEIKKGESLGIVGPNGSGKSTLLKVLSGITKPSSGKVYIKGKVASILDIGAGFHPELNGHDNIFLNGHIHGFSRKEILKKKDEIIQFSGIAKFIHEPVKNYSNGMYLRLAFSIMAHLDFDLYLLDEVMNVGDVDFQKQSSLKLAEIISGGKNCLFASHNLFELKQLFNNFLYLENGHLTKVNSHEVSSLIYKKQEVVLSLKPDIQHPKFEILNMSVQSTKKEDPIVRDAPIYIEFEYQHSPDVQYIEFAVRIKKDSIPFGYFAEKFPITYSTSETKISRIALSEEFLNAGLYQLDLFAGINPSDYVFQYDCMSFEVKSNPNKIITVNEPVVIIRNDI